MDNKKKSRNAIIIICIFETIAYGMFIFALWITNNLFKLWAIVGLVVMGILGIICCVIWAKLVNKKIEQSEGK